MDYSPEFIKNMDEFIDVCESNKLFMEKSSSNSIEPLTDEEEKAVTEWIESGDPEVMKFLKDFAASDYFKEVLLNH